jgi:hypothetical protein
MTQQTIERTYTTSEQSKLLKEKGFDWQVGRFYTKPNAKIFAVDEHGRHYPIKNTPKKLYVVGENFVLKDENTIPAPEQWEVCEWLRINHSIHIEVYCDVYGEVWFANLKVCSKEVWEDLDKRHDIILAHHKFNNEHKSKQEAYSAAFDYILKKLI